jgi:hypothetical protein
VWTRNNAAGIWDCRVELPHDLAGPEAAPGAAAEGPTAPPSNGEAVQGGSASKRPPLHPGAASGAAAPAPPPPSGGGIPRKRSVPAIPEQEDVEKRQPGVTAQADDSRLLGSAAAAGAAPPQQGGGDADGWRPLLEEQLRWVAGAGVSVLCLPATHMFLSS